MASTPQPQVNNTPYISERSAANLEVIKSKGRKTHTHTENTLRAFLQRQG